MFKIIGILLGVICVLIIAKLIINKIKENKEKEIDFNEFDDLEKIKLTKHYKQHMENEWKALQKVKREQEYYQQMKKEKERERQRKKEKLKQERRIKAPKEQEMDNLIDTVTFINDSIVNTVETKLLDYGKHTNKEEMKILIKAQMKEYIMNIQNKKVIRGSKNKRKEKNIIMTFHKKNDHLEQEGFLGSCPNCGAPISQIEFGKCKYCGTVVVPIRYNWVLVKFETI